MQREIEEGDSVAENERKGNRMELRSDLETGGRIFSQRAGKMIEGAKKGSIMKGEPE